VNDKTKPFVSVLIATYNSAGYLRETVASVLTQTFADFELLLIDDGSTDNTVAVSRELAMKDDRIILLSVPHSGLPAVPFNLGLRTARGVYVAFLGSDDLWTPNKLADQVHYLKTHPELLFLYGMSFSFGAVHLLSPKYELLPLPFRFASDRDGLLRIGNTVPASSVLARLDAIRDVGYYSEDPEINEDYDLWIKLAEKGPFGFIPRIQVYYRIHDQQISGSWETRARRLDRYAEKTGLTVAKHKAYRNKGLLFLFVRNSIHFVCKQYAALLDFIEQQTGKFFYQ
jgi:glycosyltransferase involved in cell wall biosynthesis